jgi:cyanophycinase-like exopeptidase
MALGERTLIRDRMPGDDRRRGVPALGLLPGIAVLPHYDTFGHRWIESARESVPELTLLGPDERTAAVWRDGAWSALGAGSVTVIRGDERSTFAGGEAIEGLPQPLVGA